MADDDHPGGDSGIVLRGYARRAAAGEHVAGAGGKGRISNDLVAASCAAVLAVYAAGYWRTRDAARGIDAQAEQRRASRAEVRIPPAAQPEMPATSLPEIATPSVPGETSMEKLPTLEKPAVSGPVPPAAAEAVEVVATLPPMNTPSVPSPTPSVRQPLTEEPSTASIPAAEPEAAVDAQAEPETRTEPYWRDGTFTGWGTSRHGDIKAQVVIRDGRIVESAIVSCETRYPCDVIEKIIPQPVQWQSPEVDRVSRATESADAYYYALVNALAEAVVEPTLQAAAPK
ncbi:MAG: hypothetical protein M3Y79_00360 [Pseudomonadota bacterium]|nr:hypothetical protein [Pseudomonadota bacterium]